MVKTDLFDIFFEPFLWIRTHRLGFEFKLDIEAVLPVEKAAQFIEAQNRVPHLCPEAVNLFRTLFLKYTAACSRAIKSVVVGDVQNAVTSHSDVGLKAGVSPVPAFLEGLQGILVAFESATSMRECTYSLGLGLNRTAKEDGEDTYKSLSHNYQL